MDVIPVAKRERHFFNFFVFIFFSPKKWNSISFHENNKEQVLEKIKLGQQYIQENHSPEMIGRKWIETEKLV